MAVFRTADEQISIQSGCDLIDVTSNHRPDTSWRYTDKAGHVHQWHTKDGQPAKAYDASQSHTTPTLKWVKDGVGYYEDGEPYDIGHNECSQCAEHIEPRFTADTERQMIAGLRWFKINGEHVSGEAYAAAIEAARHK